MKILLFKISSCHQCQEQEKIYNEHGIAYIPCELFKNRQLARLYGVTDVPATVIVDDNNFMLRKYNTLLSGQNLKKLTYYRKKYGK